MEDDGRRFDPEALGKVAFSWGVALGLRRRGPRCSAEACA